MTIEEFSDQFDLLYNNITSNQAPGISEYEKSVFATKAEKEIVKNYFTANSQGNTLQQGFDDSAKRQADFSMLLATSVCTAVENPPATGKIDSRSLVFTFPNDVFIIINETIQVTPSRILQVIPLKYDDYTRLMSKPFKRPLKYQAWRLMNSGTVEADTSANKGKSTKKVEIVLHSGETVASNGYSIRYIKVPSPIILTNLSEDGLSIDGQATKSTKIDIDPILHEDILQRAVELAKIAWTQTGQDNTQAVLQSGQRTE